MTGEQQEQAVERRRRRQVRQIDKLLPSGHKMSRPILITNTSLWPTMTVEQVADFVVHRIRRRGGKVRVRHVTVRHTTHRNGGHGRAWTNDVLVSHNRSSPRSNWKYVGIAHAKSHTTKTALQSLCHIMAHEMVHVSDLVACERHDSDRRKLQQYEIRTDDIAAEIVAEFADCESDIWRQYKRHRRRQRNAITRRASAIAQRMTPDAKIERAEMNLARWQEKLDKAQRYVRRWETKVNRLNGAQKAAMKRAAMKSQNNA